MEIISFVDFMKIICVLIKSLSHLGMLDILFQDPIHSSVYIYVSYPLYIDQSSVCLALLSGDASRCISDSKDLGFDFHMNRWVQIGFSRVFGDLRAT